MFQFPLHRDPRCNTYDLSADAEVVGFSSLYIGILAATGMSYSLHQALYCFSSLYIGILAATPQSNSEGFFIARVSVPFTSGSSLQRKVALIIDEVQMFQFPLHRDPRCN